MSRVIVLVIFCSAIFNACSTPQIHITDPVSMQLWTDHPDEPDPLAACQRVTGETDEGTCVVMTLRALAWWQLRWAACEAVLEDCERGR